jgi:hypothetical protein
MQPETLDLKAIGARGHIKVPEWFKANLFRAAGGTSTEIHRAMVSNLFPGGPRRQAMGNRGGLPFSLSLDLKARLQETSSNL